MAGVNASRAAERVARKLEAISQAIEPEVRAAMQQRADKITGLQRALAPVLKRPDPRREAGRLKRSVGWTWGQPKAAVVLQSRSTTRIKFGGQLATITIFAGDAAAFYARWEEFGTQARPKGRYRDNEGRSRRNRHRSHPATPKHPFFYVVWRAEKNNAKAAIRAAWKRAIKRGVATS